MSNASSSTARPGAQQAALSANNGQFAPLLLNARNPCHLYRGYEKCANYVPTEITVQPCLDSTGDGGTTEFRIDAHGDKLGTLDLRFKVSIQQDGEAGGTGPDFYIDTEDGGAEKLIYTAMVGGAAYRVPKKIEIRNGTNRIHEFSPVQLFLSDFIYADGDKRIAIDRLTGMNNGAMGLDDGGAITGTFEDAQGRDTSGVITAGDPVKSSDRYYSLRLPTFWGASLDRWMDIKSIGAPLVICVTWAEAREYAYTNYRPGATYTISEPTIRARYTHISKAERAANDARVNGTRDGFTMKWVTWRNQPKAEIKASDGERYTLKLDNLRGSISHGFVLVQKKESGYDGTPATAALRGRGGVEGSRLSAFYYDTQPFHFLDIATYEVTSTGATLFPETDDLYAKNRLYADHFPSVGTGIAAYPVMFTYNAIGDWKNSMGGIDITNVHQPELHVYRPGGLVQGAEVNRLVSFEGVAHDWWTISGGEVVKVFFG